MKLNTATAKSILPQTRVDARVLWSVFVKCSERSGMDKGV